MTRAGVIRLVTCGLLAVALVSAATVLPISSWVLSLVDWMRGAGAAGVALYVAGWAVVALLFLPGSIMAATAGFLYGPFLGVLIASPASAFGAAVAFLTGRYLLREQVWRRVAHDRRFLALDQAVREDAFRLVLISRMTPILPFAPLNYAMGLTRVGLGTFTLATWLGMIPGTVLYVYLGTVASSLSELLAGRRPPPGPAQQVLTGVGLVATVLVTVLITRITRRALRTPLEIEGD